HLSILSLHDALPICPDLDPHLTPSRDQGVDAHDEHPFAHGDRPCHEPRRRAFNPETQLLVRTVTVARAAIPPRGVIQRDRQKVRSEEHTSELQSSYD